MNPNFSFCDTRMTSLTLPTPSPFGQNEIIELIAFGWVEPKSNELEINNPRNVVMVQVFFFLGCGTKS